MTKLSLVILFWCFMLASLYFAHFGIWNTAITLLILSFLVEGIDLINRKYKVFK